MNPSAKLSRSLSLSSALVLSTVMGGSARAEAPAAPSGSGLTADYVGRRSAQTSFSAAAAGEAWRAFLPHLEGDASYTRLSSFSPPALFPFGVAATNAPAGTANPATTSSGPIVIPLVLNQYSVGANIAVPITDYFLKIEPTLRAAKGERVAAAYQAVVARATAATEGQVAFYTWMRAKSALEIALQARDERHVQVDDMHSQLTEGNASKADALRVEAAFDEADAVVVASKALLVDAETQLRTALHDEGARLDSAEPLDVPLAPVGSAETDLKAEALRSRVELKAFTEDAQAQRATASATRSTLFPSLSAVGAANYSNPNPRYFPPADTWTGTWALGVQATWSPTDALTADSRAHQVEARAEVLDAQQAQLRDSIGVEVVQTYQSVLAADAIVHSTERQVASANEAFRVARALSLEGLATASNVIDAETDAIRARLARVNALADARIARVRLTHAVGRDQQEFGACTARSSC